MTRNVKRVRVASHRADRCAATDATHCLTMSYKRRIARPVQEIVRRRCEIRANSHKGRGWITRVCPHPPVFVHWTRPT